MTELVHIQIIGAPLACAEGVKETWRELGIYFAGQLRERYGPSVETTYYDLFDPACPPLPPEAQLPIVLVAGRAVINGGKLSLPLIRRYLESLGITPLRSHPAPAGPQPGSKQ